MAKLGDEVGHLWPNVGVADVVAVPEIGGEVADGGGAAPLAENSVDVPGFAIEITDLQSNPVCLQPGLG